MLVDVIYRFSFIMVLKGKDDPIGLEYLIDSHILIYFLKEIYETIFSPLQYLSQQSE